MKIKSDFVTNSSSTGFIVSFPSKVKTVYDIVDYIAPKYIETILNDCKNQTPIKKKYIKTKQKIAMEVRCGVVDGGFSSYYYQQTLMKNKNIKYKDLRENRLWEYIIWDETNLKDVANSFDVTNKFLEKVSDNDWIYFFEYSDDDGDYYAEIENSDIFYKLPNIQINKH